MADDKSNRGPADRERINVNENDELRYWSRKFGCTHDELKAAVRRVGVMPAYVQTELKRSKGR